MLVMPLFLFVPKKWINNRQRREKLDVFLLKVRLF